MAHRITYLKPVPRPTATTPRPPAAVFVGRKYSLRGEPPAADTHGICGGFSCSLASGGAMPLHLSASDQACYLWDSDAARANPPISIVTGEDRSVTLGAETSVANNRFVLANTSLGKPEIHLQDGEYGISLRAGFDFVYTADQMQARLGALSLVTSNCFLILQNGEKHSLLNSGEDRAVLYASTEQHAEPVSPILDAENSEEPVQESWQQCVTHAIPESLAGLAVETMTILEQYQTYFLQRELPFSQDNIWTPTCAPVSWGWSIRIARRHDGEWGIARQKLLMPALDHNGLALPAWEGNSLNR